MSIVIEGFWAQLIAAIIMGVAASALGALVVLGATNGVCKFTPPYRTAIGACVLTYTVAISIRSIAYLLLFGPSADQFTDFFVDHVTGTSLVLFMVISFFAGALIYGYLIKNKNGEPIDVLKGVLVSLAAVGVQGVFIFIVGFIYYIARIFIGYRCN